MKKQNILRTAAALLTLLTLVPAVISCGGEGTKPEETKAKDPTGTEGGEETDEGYGRENVKDDLPDNLDFEQREINVYVGSVIKNESYFKGHDQSTGDKVDDAILERNNRVAARLNIKLNHSGFDLDWETTYPTIQKLVMAGDETYDIFIGQQCGLTRLVSDNLLYNAYDLENINWDKPWWNNNYMNELSLGENNRYFLISDYFIDVLRMTDVLFYNKVIYTTQYDDANELYNIVLDGNWTYDKFADLVLEFYQDLNNNGVTDTEDRVGFAAVNVTSSVDPFIYSTDIAFTERDADGFVEFTMNNNDAGVLAERIVDLYASAGVIAEENAADMFINGKALFVADARLLTAQKYRDMEDDFGMIPYPKFDAEQKEYRSLVHDGALIGCVSGSCANTDIIGAVLEALNSETYRSVTPLWYEESLKIKYTRDQLSRNMIDLIHDSTATSFVYAYSFALDNIGNIYRDLVRENNANYASAIAERENQVRDLLDGIVAIYKGE